MIFERCIYCHKYIFTWLLEAHVEKHTKLGEDGQQADYATLPEAERQGVDQAYQEAPKWYQHEICGKITGMPEEIIKTYLKDPWFYSDQTFCTGCKKMVPHSECYWRETGQNLGDYKKELRMAARKPPIIRR